MSQRSNVIADSDGGTFLTALDAALAAMVSGHSGTARPAYVAAGTIWIDTAVPGSGVWTVYLYDGANDVAFGVLDTTAHTWTPAGATALLVPQGRLTLTSGAPVLSSGVSGAATIYYSPYNGNQIPIYNGAGFLATTFVELSNATTQSSTGKAGPAAVTTNSNYDLFVWNDSGTIRLTRGPAWTSDTARGTGAGTTELQRLLGILTNKVAITNGPGANLGTYVGTVRSDGASQINYQMNPAAAAGGAAPVIGVWNAYNQVAVATTSRDSTASWSYGTATWRSANNSASNRISFIDGLGGGGVRADYLVGFGANGGDTAFIGVNLNSTSATPNVAGILSATGAVIGVTTSFAGAAALGFNYVQAVEKGDGTAALTFYGAGIAATQVQQISATVFA